MSTMSEPTQLKAGSSGLPPQNISGNGSMRQSAMADRNDSIQRQMSLIGGKKYKRSRGRRKTTHGRRRTTRGRRRRTTTRGRRTKRYKKQYKGGKQGIIPPTAPPGATPGAQNSYNKLASLSASSIENSKYD